MLSYYICIPFVLHRVRPNNSYDVYVCIPENRNIWRKYILEEIVSCERITHKNLTQKLRVLYQLIYYWLARKKNGGHHIRLEDIREYTLQMHNVSPLPCFSRHL